VNCGELCLIWISSSVYYQYNVTKNSVDIGVHNFHPVCVGGGCSPAKIVGSNPTGGMYVCKCCVISGRRLCDELITHPEESCWLWCSVCDLETLWMRRPWPTGWLSHQKHTMWKVLCYLTLWPQSRKLKFWHICCVKREYFMSQKIEVNEIQGILWRIKNGDFATCLKKFSKYICWLNMWNIVIGCKH